jgi:hypothetical protein
MDDIAIKAVNLRPTVGIAELAESYVREGVALADNHHAAGTIRSRISGLIKLGKLPFYH